MQRQNDRGREPADFAKAKNEVSDRIQQETQSAGEALHDARDEVARRAGAYAAEAEQAVAEKAEQTQRDIGSSLSAFGGAQRAASDHLAGSDQGAASNFMQEAASGLERLSSSLKEKPFAQVLEEDDVPTRQRPRRYRTCHAPDRLAAMMLLFHAMASSLAMVYDREMGSMRLLLTAPLPHWYLLAARLLASVIVGLPLVYLFLFVARFWDVRPPILGYVAVFPALLLSGLMLGAFGLLVSSMSTQMENFAGVMNFVIFPMFFTSTALYPIWRLAEAGPVLATIAAWNPFSSAVELIRFTLYLRFDTVSMLVVVARLVAFFVAAVAGYDPGRGLWARRGGEG